MRLATALLFAAIATLPDPAQARRGGGRAARGTVTIEGEPADVRWTDGDTFVILSGRYAGDRVRLGGVNTLETFGAVHRMGAADRWELLALAKGSAKIAAAAGGPCEIAGRDRYGRRLARCPEVAEALVRTGHAMVFAVDPTPPDPALVAAQAAAQRSGAGMWAWGAPRLVPTSLRSADERGLGPRGAYDRIADTRSGVTEERRHERVYAVCEEVCLGAGEDRACMIYVPFEMRYRDRPECLRRPPARARRR